MSQNLIEITEQYFKSFSDKDLSGLENMFSKDISLKDWDTNAQGIENVLEINKEIFKNLNHILVTPSRIFNDGNTVIAELEININNGEQTLLVLDIIEFNKENKIMEIRAYKR